MKENDVKSLDKKIKSLWAIHKETNAHCLKRLIIYRINKLTGKKLDIIHNVKHEKSPCFP